MYVKWRWGRSHGGGGFQWVPIVIISFRRKFLRHTSHISINYYHIQVPALNATQQHKIDVDCQPLILKEKRKGSLTITLKGRRGVTGFYARHFSISQLRDGSAYLLSVAVFFHLRCIQERAAAAITSWLVDYLRWLGGSS